MKLRVLFLKKIHILYLMFFIIACCTGILLLKREKDMDVFKTVREKTLLKSDLTGDGKEDMLYINTENDKYFLQVNSNNKSFSLLPDKKMNTLGYYYPFYPMKINLLDISRDKVPEIFMQSMEKGRSIQHLFLWNGTDFIDKFCSSNNIMGIIDSKNNRTPKFVSGNFNNNSFNFSYYMQLSGNIEKIQFSDTLPGQAEILGIINYIHSLPSGELSKPADIFYPGVTGKDLSLIGKMAAEKKLYKFTDGFFIDSKFNKAGEPIEYKWILNFKATPPGSSADSESRSIIVKLKRLSQPEHPFKIASITENIK